MKVLVVDIGGSHIKLLASGHRKPIEIDSGKHITPGRMVREVLRAARDWQYDVASLGYPGVVRNGRPIEDAPNLGRGWVRFDFQKAFGRPVKIMNDAAMQALGSYRGKRMLFLGLGTGLGSTLILDGIVHTMELGDLPYREGRTYGEFLGKPGRRRLGTARWVWHVTQVIRIFKEAIQPDYIVLGGGQADRVKRLPAGVLHGGNFNAFKGGFRLWEKKSRRPRRVPSSSSSFSKSSGL